MVAAGGPDVRVSKADVPLSIDKLSPYQSIAGQVNVARILVDIPQKYLDELGAIARVEKRPRAEIIRRAIADYVEQNRPATADAFGIWKERQVGGLDYQEAIRSEW
jgi:hypothetical protein